MPNLDVRPEVAAFALLMEKRLRENDHKPGWKNDDRWALYRRIKDETNELALAIGSRIPLRSKIGSEAADVANFAMMVADVCGALSVEGKGDA